MGIRNKISDGYVYFLTLTVVEWVDVFTRPVYKHIIIDSLIFCQKEKGLIIYSWCLMSNHLHLIVQAKEDINLSDILRDFKKFTSKQIIKRMLENPESRREWMLDRFRFAGKFKKNVTYKFWQDGNEAKEIHSSEFLLQKLEYIHDNPVKAEIVENPNDYKYSSAINYAGGKGLIDVVLI
ncbi:transposase [Ancylomarina euxinus]|uniref:Transposase n=1 Tax=Ancylomarina euxinus TaxID=2283627 RepID=A0A425XZJ9_9BACT|nr:transposase [Ancylomarina euxinus]MCZ4694816.1 transposase [Ancylomarina euxinus]MUP15890.1 transposase [Ancylomarina euxinus]RRG20527.1 transposase [Ancylomarina euxinus]